MQRSPTIPELTEAFEMSQRRGLERARKTQAERVMPMIGPMLDQYEGLPNDLKADEELSALFVHLEAIATAMERG